MDAHVDDILAIVASKLFSFQLLLFFAVFVFRFQSTIGK